MEEVKLAGWWWWVGCWGKEEGTVQTLYAAYPLPHFSCPKWTILVLVSGGQCDEREGLYRTPEGESLFISAVVRIPFPLPMTGLGMDIWWNPGQWDVKELTSFTGVGHLFGGFLCCLEENGEGKLRFPISRHWSLLVWLGTRESISGEWEELG